MDISLPELIDMNIDLYLEKNRITIRNLEEEDHDKEPLSSDDNLDLEDDDEDDDSFHIAEDSD